MKARIRTIKPEAFTDEDLWDLEQETGLPIFRAFAGLWCHADREGRFEWRARPLKAGILPYWDGDFSRVLDALATRGLLVRYAVNGREYGYIPGFKKHQAINAREEESKLPSPDLASNNSEDLHACGTRESRVDYASAARHDSARGERNGIEGNRREGKKEHASTTTVATATTTTEPRNLEQALSMPIGDRARFAEANQHFAAWLCPEQWPELKTFAEVACDAMGIAAAPLAAYQRDPGVRALVTLFATFTPGQLAQALTAIPDDPWFRSRRGLSSFSVEVVRRLLDARPDAPQSPARGSKRQPDYPGEQTFRPTEQIQLITEAAP